MTSCCLKPCPSGMREREQLASQEPVEQHACSGDSTAAAHLWRPNSLQIVKDDGEELFNSERLNELNCKFSTVLDASPSTTSTSDMH